MRTAKDDRRGVGRLYGRMADYWSYPVMIGVIASACSMVAFSFPWFEPYLTRVSIYRHLGQTGWYAMSALLLSMIVIACVVPYWGGVICAFVICAIRLAAYTNPFNLTAYGVYGAIVLTTVISVRKQYRLSKWVVQQKERANASPP